VITAATAKAGADAETAYRSASGTYLRSIAPV
jgi:hypothetical protein